MWLRSIALAFAFLNMAACLTGCSNRLTDAELETLRKEAIALNAEMETRQEKDRRRRNWQFVVQGQTSKGQSVRFSLPELKALATTSIWTKEPHNTNDPDANVHFRGVTISTLLKQFGVASNATEVTFVAYDAYRATVSLADLRQYPIMIALERNEKKISRIQGGPLYLVFPYSQFPQLQVKYPDRFWAFYITDMIVGTESIQLKVDKVRRAKPQTQATIKQPTAKLTLASEVRRSLEGSFDASSYKARVLTPTQNAARSPSPSRTFNATALGKLKQITIEEFVGYRIGWPASKVKLHGVLVRDVLAAAGITLSQNEAVIVRGKSPIYDDPANPIRLEASDLNKCNVLLATHWGDNRSPIPAKMGGPVTLAFSSGCQGQSDQRRWVTFVEELQVIDKFER